MVRLRDGSYVPREWCHFTTIDGKEKIKDVDMKCVGTCDGECDDCNLQRLFNEYAELSGQMCWPV